MSTDPTLLGCFMNVLRKGSWSKMIDQVIHTDSLQMFDQVIVEYVDETWNGGTCYICLGKHGLYFVSKEMQECKKMLSYLDIEKAAVCTKTSRRMLLQLTPDRNSSSEVDEWVEDKLIIRSDFRQQLIDRIAVCWQAEYMYKNFLVKRFPIGKIDDIPLTPVEELHNIDMLKVEPNRGYDPNFSYRGYSFFLREGFTDFTGMKSGSFRHNEGWEVSYGFATNKVIVPPECAVTIHVNDPVALLELEKDSERDDLRTVATIYRLALSEGLDQLYVLANNSYMKRQNRSGDLASWEGWELLIRSRHSCFVCVILRRMFIPPLCDLAQDIAVLIRCPASPNMSFETHEVLLDECRYIADSIAPLSTISSKSQLYTPLMQARLDALQFNEDAYCWLQGYADLEPAHSNLALRFIKSLAAILEDEGQNQDEELLKCPLLRSEEITVSADPFDLTKSLMSDYQDYLGESGTTQAALRRSAWTQRIARYLAYCIDGGTLGDRFTLSNIVSAIGKCSSENDKLLKSIIEYLLDARLHTEQGVGRAMPLMQLLQDPDLFTRCEFNERVMRGLLMDNYIQNEWRKREQGKKSVHYEKLLAALLRNGNIGIGLRTLICRQILELVNVGSKGGNVDKQIEVLVPALCSVMEGKNVNLVSCATAALVNLSCGYMATKTLLMQQGCMKLLIQQLKRKDDDLTLYTLYLLVNMSKTPAHRSVIVANGGVALLVDILSSSYQSSRKKKILTELCSVFGQLCNDASTRSLLTDEYPVTSCLLWLFDSADPNSKLKSKILFALRQLCGQMHRLSGPGRAPGGSLAEEQNKIKVGQHVIYTVLEEFAEAKSQSEEVAMNTVLLLIVLSSVTVNAKEIFKTLDQRLVQNRMMAEGGQLTNNGKFSQELLDKVSDLRDILRSIDYEG